MTNNWDDIEDLLKKKLSSGAGPMMDSEQMWANVSQSLPNRKRKRWIFGLALLILVGGAFGIVGYFGKDGKSVGVREFESLKTENYQSLNGRDTLQCVSGEGMDNIGNFGIVGYFGKDGNDGNDGFVGNIGSIGKDGDFGSIGNDGNVGKNGEDGESVEVREYGSLRNDVSQTANGRDTLQCVSGEGMDNIGNFGEFGSIGNNGSIGNFGIMEDVERMERMETKTSSLDTKQSALISAETNNEFVGGLSPLSKAHGKAIYAGAGWNAPLLPSADALQYAPILSSEYFIGYNRLIKNNWVYDLRLGIAQMNHVVKYDFEKKQDFTYINVPLHVYVDQDGNVIETQYGDTTVNQTITRKLVHNNLSTSIAFQAKWGKRFEYGRFATDAYVAIKGMYVFKQTGRYAINQTDFSLPDEANKYGWKSMLLLPGISLSESYTINNNWKAGIELNYFLLNKNAIQTSLPKAGHLIGFGFQLNYFINP